MEIMGNLSPLGLIRAHHSFIDPMAVFEEIIPARNGIFERHMPQLNTQDRSRDNPHRAGPENLSNLCGNLVELRWLWVEVWP